MINHRGVTFAWLVPGPVFSLISNGIIRLV